MRKSQGVETNALVAKLRTISLSLLSFGGMFVVEGWAGSRGPKIRRRILREAAVEPWIDWGTARRTRCLALLQVPCIGP